MAASPSQTRVSINIEDDIKDDSKHVESQVQGKAGLEAVAKPESLAGMSDEELKKLEVWMVRKLDMVIMPIIGILYILNYVDRQALSSSKLYGIMDDLGMTTQQFATAISILFAGYIPFQIPSNLVMTKISRPGLYICSAATVWGSISALTAAAKSYRSLLGIRVALGISEAVLFPGIIYFLSAWYTKKELGKRLAGLYIFQMLGSAFGGLIAAGCLTLDGRYGIAGWRWLFIVEGVTTVGSGILFALVMPEYPQNARLLKPVERDYAVWRLEMEAGAGEAHDDTTTLQGFKLALLDPKVWAMTWSMGMIQAIGSSVNFLPTIAETLGYDQMKTLLLTAPPYLFAALCFVVISYISDRKNMMYEILLVCIGVGLVADVIALSTLSTGPRYFAMMLMPFAVAGPQIMVYKTTNLHIARPFTKRAASVAIVNSIGGISNIWASYLYYDGPHYYAAFGTLLGCEIALLITVTVYRFHVRRLNKDISGTSEQQRKAMKSGVTQQQLDLGWRYVGF